MIPQNRPLDSPKTPKDFPPYGTVHHYFIWRQCDGVLDRIHHVLHVACREKAEREASPTAAIIDSQSVKSSEKGGLASIRMAMMRAKRSRARRAPYTGRYARFAAECHRPFRRHSRPRWRHLTSGD